MTGIQEANVYGVAVPGMDGRAGMAAIVVRPRFDLKALAAISRTRCPPMRARFSCAFAGDRNHRHLQAAQSRLVQEGFDPVRIGDPLYVTDPESSAFRLIDVPLYRRVIDGKMRL